MRLHQLVLLLAALSVTVGALEIPAVVAENEMTLDGTEMLQQQRELTQSQYEYSWLKKYSLRFESCHELPEYDSSGRAFKYQTMVKFRACPSQACDVRCRGGALYAADAKDFIPVYMESTMTFNEKTCQHQRNQCEYKCHNQYYSNGQYYNKNQNNQNNNNNNNNQNKNKVSACVSNCLTNVGYESCYLDVTKGEISVENYLDCRQLPHKNSNTGSYYYGKAYCGNLGQALYMGVYEDASCTRRVDAGAVAFFNTYGVKLPYATTSFVSHDCVSCQETNKFYYDADEEDEHVIYNCESLYARSLKCENRKFLDVLHPNTSGCRFIKRTLPYMDDINRGSQRSRFFTILAWVLGFTMFWCCVVACMMGRKQTWKKRLLDGEH